MMITSIIRIYTWIKQWFDFDDIGWPSMNSLFSFEGYYEKLKISDISFQVGLQAFYIAICIGTEISADMEGVYFYFDLKTSLKMKGNLEIAFTVNFCIVNHIWNEIKWYKNLTLTSLSVVMVYG